MSDDASARALFAEYKVAGLAKIQDDLTNHAEEGENLDFKRCTSNGGALSNGDKVNFAELASAFANTSGGVLVWGVDCAKNTQNIDAVSALAPFNHLAAFRSALRSITPTVLQPGLNGVEFHRILDQGQTDTGFLVVFIPAAPGEPIRAAATGTHRYYIRIGDQSQVMPHSILADRFGRRPHPKLELRWWLSSKGESRYGTEITLTLAIYNFGLGIAKHPYARLEKVTGTAIHPYSNDYMTTSQASKTNPKGAPEIAWSGKAGVVVQPDTYLEFTTITFTIPKGQTSLDLEIPYTLLCEGDQHKGVMTVQAGQIKDSEVYRDERK